MFGRKSGSGKRGTSGKWKPANVLAALMFVAGLFLMGASVAYLFVAPALIMPKVSCCASDVAWVQGTVLASLVLVCGLVMALVSIVLSFNGPRKERAEERECAIRIREIENKAQLDRARLDAKAVLSAAVGCGNDGGADAGKKKKRKKRTSARRRRAR